MYIDKKISSKLRNFISIAVLFLIIAPPRTTFANTDQTRAQVSSTDAQVPSAATSYGQLPLSFIPNVGQSDAVVLYQVRAMGGMVFFINDAVVLSLPNTEGIQQKGDQTQTIVQLHSMEWTRLIKWLMPNECQVLSTTLSGINHRNGTSTYQLMQALSINNSIQGLTCATMVRQ